MEKLPNIGTVTGKQVLKLLGDIMTKILSGVIPFSSLKKFAYLSKDQHLQFLNGKNPFLEKPFSYLCTMALGVYAESFEGLFERMENEKLIPPYAEESDKENLKSLLVEKNFAQQKGRVHLVYIEPKRLGLNKDSCFQEFFNEAIGTPFEFEGGKYMVDYCPLEIVFGYFLRNKEDVFGGNVMFATEPFFVKNRKGLQLPYFSKDRTIGLDPLLSLQGKIGLIAKDMSAVFALRPVNEDELLNIA